MAVAGANERAGAGGVGQEPLQGEEQVVVVEEIVLGLERAVGLAKAGDGLGVGQQVEGFAGDDVADFQLLVAGLGEQAQDGRFAGKRPVALAQAEPVLALAQDVLAVGGVEAGESRGKTGGLAVAAQRGKGEGVEGAAGHARDALGSKGQKQPGPGEHLLGGLAGEGQKQDGGRLHALEHQMGQTVDDGAGLAAAGAGDDQDRPFGGADGLKLGGVQFAGEIHGNSLGSGRPREAATTAPASEVRCGREPSESHHSASCGLWQPNRP